MKNTKIGKEALKAIKEIEEGFLDAKKAGVKKLPKSIIRDLQKIDKQFKNFEKMIKKANK